MSGAISDLSARMILDSRGNPTVEVSCFVDGELRGQAAVPSGASTGSYEAVELRDGGEHWLGKGVVTAVSNVNGEIRDAIVGMDPSDQNAIDTMMLELDGTRNKSRLGANAILGISLAMSHAAAMDFEIPLYKYLGGEAGRELPVPMVNIISGGRHASGGLDFQDFLVIPVGAHTYGDGLRDCSNVYRAMGELLTQKGIGFAGVADEGGYGLNLKSNEDALDLLTDAIEFAGYAGGIDRDMAIGLDVAASEFFDGARYELKCENRSLTSLELIEMLMDWHRQYPIISIEDGLAEDDWGGWKVLTDRLAPNVQLIGDDLFTTNLDRLERGIVEDIANSILVKPNQVGSLTETLDVVTRAQQANVLPVVSARSGETEDATIADLAVATNAGQIKIGSLTRSERLSKYNQLLRIEEELGDEAIYKGRQVFARFMSSH